MWRSFSTDPQLLKTAIDGIYAYRVSRNIASGLQSAEKLLDQVSEADAIKNVILCTTGMTNDGDSTTSGHYNESTVGSGWYRMDTGVPLYAYANVAYAAAEAL